MAPAKLTEAEKETIFRLYRETDETTSTLSRQYGVSVSTISRLLKSKLPPDEYEDLVRLKRSGLNRSTEDEEGSDSLGLAEDDLEETGFIADSEPQVLASDRSETGSEIMTEGDRRRRRRSSSGDRNFDDRAPAESQQLDLLSFASPPAEPVSLPVADSSRPVLRKTVVTPAAAEPLAEAMKETLVEPPVVEPVMEEEDEEDYVYAFGDEEFGDEGDEEEEFEDEEDLEDGLLEMPAFSGSAIEILPLSQARFPRTCYLVIDRMAELVTCRLQDFRELGPVPESEAQHRTLPLFDNHRIARRFSRRNQRVIKLPDGRLLYKTARWLQAKGITRLFLDGKVYALADAPLSSISPAT